MSPDPLTPLRVFKVLWVRQRTNGLHAFKCIPVYMDYQARAFLVCLRSGGPAKRCIRCLQQELKHVSLAGPGVDKGSSHFRPVPQRAFAWARIARRFGVLDL